MHETRLPNAPRSNSVFHRPIQVWVRPMLTALMWIIATVVVLYFFGAIKLLLLGGLAATAMAALLRPIERKIPGPRGVGALVVGLGAILVVGALLLGVGLLIAAPIQRQWDSWPQVRQQLDSYLQNAGTRLGVEHPPTTMQILQQVAGWAAGSGGEMVSGVAAMLVNLAIALAFIFIGSMYILADPPGKLSGPFVQLLPPKYRNPIRRAMDDLEPGLRWWLIGTIISMALVGVATGIGYTVIGLQFAIPLAMLAALAEIVPTVGPIIGVAIALVFAAIQGSNQIIGVLIVYAVVQILESYVILPLVMRQAVDIPPIVTLFSVVLWGHVFGAPGLILAIPIDLLIGVLVYHLVLRRREKPAEEGPAP